MKRSTQNVIRAPEQRSLPQKKYIKAHTLFVYETICLYSLKYKAQNIFFLNDFDIQKIVNEWLKNFGNNHMIGCRRNDTEYSMLIT